MAIYYVSLPPIGLRYAVFAVPAIWSAILVPNKLGWRRAENERRGGLARRMIFAPVAFFARGEYRQYWLASFLFWLVALAWVRYPHPAIIVGWIALCGYLACYFPLFIAQTRAASTLLRLPVWLASTFSWLAVEALRNVVFGGFSLAGLSYALYDAPEFIQIADFFGEYGVALMIVLAGSLLGCGLVGGAAARLGGEAAKPRRSPGPRLVSCALLVVLATYLYGAFALERFDELERETLARGARPARLALLQCGISYRFPVPDSVTRRVEDAYLALAREASEDPVGYDAIVWPEGTYPGFFVDFDFDPSTREVEDSPNAGSLPNAPSDADTPAASHRYDREWVKRRMRAQRLELANLTARLRTPALLGMASAVFDEEGRETSYNALIDVPYFGSEEKSAALPSEVLERAPTSSYYESRDEEFRRYDKVALVMFGEYIPFADKLPDSWGIKAACADVALGRGRGPTTFRIPAREGGRSCVVAPHICFESIVPQFISGQLAELRDAGVDPDVLLNVSNDGWFRNGAETDLHLASMVFRAVENRRPLATATHGGFSAYIDAAGRVREKGERGATRIVDARIAPVKTHPAGLVKRGAGETFRFVAIPDVMRRLGYVVFLACCAAQIALFASRKRANRQNLEVEEP